MALARRAEVAKARAGAGCLELGAPVEHPAGAGLESHRNISTKGVSSATGESAGVPLERQTRLWGERNGACVFFGVFCLELEGLLPNF